MVYIFLLPLDTKTPWEGGRGSHSALRLKS